MTLDGNTEWSPDEVDQAADDAVDAGATVAIGPLPARPAGDVPDPADDDDDVPNPAADNAADADDDGGEAISGPLFGPVLGPAERDRPPMVAGLFPAGQAEPLPEHAAVTTGPPPTGDGGIEPLPTGPIPVSVSAPVTATGPSAAVFLQAAVVLLAAGLVGLVVFGVLRSAAGNGLPTDRADADRANGLSLDPGPGDPGLGDADPNGDAIGSRRGTAGLGRGPADEDDIDGSDRASGPVDLADGGPLDPAGPTTAGDPSETTTSVARSTSSSEPVASTTTPRSSTAADVTPTKPTTTAVTSSTTSPTNDGSSTTVPPTTRPASTTTIATTTIPETTTTKPTTTNSSTTTTTLPASLIAAPRNGGVATWEAPLTLRANPVPGASSYCWTLSGTGGDVTRCRSGVRYRLPAGRARPGPGPVVITAEARTAEGKVIMSEEISITLLARDVVNTPSAGDSHDLDERLRLVAKRIPPAERYCWTLIQGDTSSGPLCGPNRRRGLAAGGSALAGFGEGPVTLRAVVEGHGVVIGRQTVRFEFTGP